VLPNSARGDAEEFAFLLEPYILRERRGDIARCSWHALSKSTLAPRVRRRTWP